MDAYNRGYNPGIAGLSDISNGSVKVGSATIYLNNQDMTAGFSDDAQAASFYALAYTVSSGVTDISPGTTVISYRGTDEPGSELVQVDFGISYFSNYRQQQILYAGQFLHQVDASNGNSSILLTGHSLGGALAGITGALNGVQSRVADNIGFFSAVNSFIDGYNQIKIYLGYSTYIAAATQYASDYNGYVYGSDPTGNT
jgi:Protein of unknown function (DUF2974)